MNDVSSKGRDRCPYPGIRPYQVDEERYFCGRENHVSQVFNLLRQHRFAAILGSSGSGKSSLINAGLIPLLRSFTEIPDASEESSNFAPPQVLVNDPMIVRLTPGDDPFARLAGGLFRARLTSEVPANTSVPGHTATPPEPASLTSDSVATWESTLGREGSHAEQLLRQHFSSQWLVLIIDQFEEFFHWIRHRRAEAARSGSDNGREAACSQAQAFISLILTLRKLPNILLVLGMRSDYLKDCSAYPALAAEIASSAFIIPVLNWEELSLAIATPLQLQEIATQITPLAPQTIRSLISHLALSIADESDTLPLAQDFLSRAWHGAQARAAKKRTAAGDPGPADFGAFLDELLPSGQSSPNSRLLQDSLDQRGDEIIGAARVEMEAVRLFFAALFQFDEDGRVTRRPLRRSKLIQLTKLSMHEADEILNAFGSDPPAWLALSPIEEVDPLIDLAHEALLRNWRIFSSPHGLPLQQTPTMDLNVAGLRRAFIEGKTRKQLLLEFHTKSTRIAAGRGTTGPAHVAPEHAGLVCGEQAGLVPLAQALQRAAAEALASATQHLPACTPAGLEIARFSSCCSRWLSSLTSWLRVMHFGLPQLLTDMRAEMLRPAFSRNRSSLSSVEAVLLGLTDESATDRFKNLKEIWDEHQRRHQIGIARRRLVQILLCTFAILMAAACFYWQEAERTRLKAEAKAARLKAEAETERLKAVAEATRLKAEAETERLKAEAETERLKGEATKQQLEAAHQREIADFKAEASYLELQRLSSTVDAAIPKAEYSPVSVYEYVKSPFKSTIVNRIAVLQGPPDKPIRVITGNSMESQKDVDSNEYNTVALQPYSGVQKDKSISIVTGANFFGRTRIPIVHPGGLEMQGFLLVAQHGRAAAIAETSNTFGEIDWVEPSPVSSVTDASIASNGDRLEFTVATSTGECFYYQRTVGGRWEMIASDKIGTENQPNDYVAEDVIEFGPKTVCLAYQGSQYSFWWKTKGAKWSILEGVLPGPNGPFRIYLNRSKQLLAIAGPTNVVCVNCNSLKSPSVFFKIKLSEPKPEQPPAVAAFDEEGGFLACSDGKDVQLIDLISLEPPSEDADAKPAQELNLGESLGSKIRMIKLVSPKNKAPRSVTSLAFSPEASEDRMLAAGFSDGSVEVWQNWDYRLRLRKDSNPVKHFSPTAGQPRRPVRSLQWIGSQIVAAAHEDAALSFFSMTVVLPGKHKRFSDVRSDDGKLALYGRKELGSLQKLKLAGAILDPSRPSDYLNPDAMFVAAPWNYTYTKPAFLRQNSVRLRKEGSPATEFVNAWPVDHCSKDDYPIVISNGVINALGLKPEDRVVLELDTYPRLADPRMSSLEVSRTK